MKTLSSEKLAYLAGFFDGEGCVRLTPPTKRRGPVLFVSIVNTNHPILEEFESYFGGSIQKASTMPWHKPKWHWVITTNKAVVFLRAIYPYLQLKKEEAEVAIVFQLHRKRCCTPERRAEAYLKYSKIKALKHAT